MGRTKSSSGCGCDCGYNPIPLPNFPPELAINGFQYSALKGSFFIAVTPEITGGTMQAVGLLNPVGSNVNLAIALSKVSNYTTNPISLEFYLNSNITPSQFTSVYGNSTNLNYNYPSKGVLLYAQGITPSGSATTTNIIPPYGTIPMLEDGVFILPPGTNYFMYINTLVTGSTLDSIVSFSWAEFPLYR